MALTYGDPSSFPTFGASKGMDVHHTLMDAEVNYNGIIKYLAC